MSALDLLGAMAIGLALIIVTALASWLSLVAQERWQEWRWRRGLPALERRAAALRARHWTARPWAAVAAARPRDRP